MSDRTAEPHVPESHIDVWRIADYYRGLRNRDVPEDAALALTIEYQRMYLSTRWGQDKTNGADAIAERTPENPEIIGVKRP